MMKGLSPMSTLVMTKNQIVRRIVKARKAKGWTTTAAAEKAKVSQPTWWRVENAKVDPTWELLFSMLKALGIKASVELRE